jgi:hypothetical protein
MLAPITTLQQSSMPQERARTLSLATRRKMSLLGVPAFIFIEGISGLFACQLTKHF